MPHKILMVAYRFPPVLSPGTARALGFLRCLPDYGFEPSVLTVVETPGFPSDPSLLEKVPSSVRVRRVEAGAHPVARSVRLLERVVRLLYRLTSHAAANRTEMPRRLQRMARAGLDMIREIRPELIWVSAPPFDALKLSTVLSERTGVPLIMDYRDPMTWGWDSRHWSERKREAERDWERRALSRASRAIFVSPMIEQRMAEHYPEHAAKFLTITNGFDDWEENDRDLVLPPRSAHFTISYVGTIYVSRGRYVRSPVVVLDGLRLLCNRSAEAAAEIRLRFVGRRCTKLAPLLAERGLGEQVELRDAVSYQESHRIMRESDALLLLQTLTGPAGDVISGKIFDYLGARRPILGVAWPGGGDEWMLREAGAGPVVGTDDPEAVASAIEQMWRKWRQGELVFPVSEEWMRRYERRALTARLAAAMDEVISGSR